MNAKTIETDDNRYRVVLTDYDGNIYEIDIFDDKHKARDVEWLLEMVISTWCYGGNLDSHYVQEYATDKTIPYDEMMEYAKALYDLLESDYYTTFGGTDSEGVSYNTIKHK